MHQVRLCFWLSFCWHFILQDVTALQTIGTLQAASAPEYFLSVFADEAESFVAGLHHSSVASAQLWVYDDQTGFITARGLELALTARDLDVILSDVVELTDDDLSSQRWDLTINQHIMLLHNGKSLYFTTAKEGIPVRLTATTSTNDRQVWIFGATVAPTTVPSPSPTKHTKHRKKTTEKSSWGRIVFLLSLPVVFILSLYLCWKYRKYIQEKVETYMNPPPPPPTRRKKPKKKLNHSRSLNGIDSTNPFGSDEFEGGGDVEMSEFPGGEEEAYNSEDDDTAPLVGSSDQKHPVPVAKSFLDSFRALFEPAPLDPPAPDLETNESSETIIEDGVGDGAAIDDGNVVGSFREGYGNIEYEVEPPIPEGVYIEEAASVIDEALHPEHEIEDSKSDSGSKKGSKKKASKKSSKSSHSNKKKGSSKKSSSKKKRTSRASSDSGSDNSDSDHSNESDSSSDSDDIPAGMGFEFGGGVPSMKPSKVTKSSKSNRKSRDTSKPSPDDEDDLLGSFVA